MLGLDPSPPGQDVYARAERGQRKTVTKRGGASLVITSRHRKPQSSGRSLPAPAPIPGRPEPSRRTDTGKSSLRKSGMRVKGIRPATQPVGQNAGKFRGNSGEPGLRIPLAGRLQSRWSAYRPAAAPPVIRWRSSHAALRSRAARADCYASPAVTQAVFVRGRGGVESATISRARPPSGPHVR
jgi:hypothetical protein